MLQTLLQPDIIERAVHNDDIEQPLVTKFIAPVPTHSMQIRTRLLAHLQHGLRYPLILVSAPAGSGKTTLLSQWIHSLTDEPISPVWVSLDAGDNDPLCFWHVLLTALARKLPRFSALQTSNNLPHLLTLLMNTVAAHQEPIILVLDDYHTITDSTIQEQMVYLIEHLPPHMHIVLSTRMDPSLPLARWRVRDLVLEVCMNVLRFTYEEATLFFQDVMHLSLSTAEISYLVNHVDGWIAGLRLAVYILSKPSSTTGVSMAVHGRQRYIFDYILEEILLTQEEYIQTFLLRTASLPHFSASLCDAVLGRQDSWQVLQYLERANLFLIAEDQEHTWYHYQPLFAEALRNHLERTESAIIPELHRLASRWYEQHGLPIELPQFYEDNIYPSELQNVTSHTQERSETQTLQPVPLVADPLSAREIEVLQLIAQGESNAEIANTLIIAPATVKRHVSNILSKLQATNRTQAVALARHHGLLRDKLSWSKGAILSLRDAGVAG